MLYILGSMLFIPSPQQPIPINLRLTNLSLLRILRLE